MRSTSAVPRVISQLEDIFRIHHPRRNNYCILHNEQCEKPRTKIFRRSYNVFPSPIEPRLPIRFLRIRSLCLQIILVRLVLLIIDIYECDFSEFGTQCSCNVFPSQSRNWNRNNMLKKTKNTPFNGYSLQYRGLGYTTLSVLEFIRKKSCNRLSLLIHIYS